MPRRTPQLAKLTRPRLSRAVARERLFKLLDEASGTHPAICVVGPPGAGKTTLVASWLDHRTIDGIWYQVDPGDADLATFFYYLGEAIRPFSHKRQPPLPALTSEYLHDIPGFSRRFFRELFVRLPPASTLVVDNYQEVPVGRKFHEIVAGAVAEVPAAATLVCISRRDPPDCYARLIANKSVAFIDWEDLKLTIEETQSIVLGQGQEATAFIQDLHERSGGWAAGLVLMLESLRSNSAEPYSATESQQAIFSYFAAQIFERVPKEVRQFLLSTADLPWVEPALGELLAGTRSAKRILDELCRRHLFTHRRAGAKPSYQYHALFREFLRAQADVSVSKAKRNELRIRSGQFLERTGSIAEAFNLYRDAQAWPAVSQLLLQHAPELVAHGRFQTLSDWIGALPPALVDREPWLAYWHGRALVTSDPASGRRLLERAHEGFHRRSDAIGEVAAAASIIDSIFIENRHFVIMDPWIEILECRLRALGSVPSVQMELRVYASALVAMLYRQPANSLMPALLDRLVSLLELDIDANSRVSAAVSVLTYASASGDFAVGHRVRSLIEPVVAGEEVATTHRFLWRVWLGYFLMLLGEYPEAEANYRAAEELNNDNQFPWSANLLFVRALSIIGGGDLQGALALLERSESVANRSRPQDLGYLHMARAWRGMIVGDAPLAKRESEAALEVAEEIGNFSLTVVWQTPKMWALGAMDQYGEFAEFIERSLKSVQNTCYRRPHVELLAVKAWILLRRGEPDVASEVLAEALELARNHNHGAFLHRICRFVPELQAFVVASKSHPAFVRGLIRQFNWSAPSRELERWPWPIKVYTLGHFSICLDDRPLSFSRKTPRKPISLLKAIIAFGERAVPAERLIDALWPQEDGDSAHHAFSLALHRLRRLMGCPDAIVVADGAVSLDRNLVWTDVAALEAVAENCKLPPSEAANKIADLYRGNFLIEEQEEPWSVSLRERLRAKFLNAVDRYGHELERTARRDEAIALYLRGLDAEPLAEMFYRGLMRCYAGQGRPAEALSIYRRLRQMLSVVLGIQPSSVTEALVKELKVH